MKVFKESIGTVLDIDSLLDILNGDTVSDVVNAIANRKKDGYSSIASRANDLTATFPILISNRVSLKTAEKIAKALEFKYALMLQLVIASKSFTTSKDAADFLKNYHTNIDSNTYGSLIGKFSSPEESVIMSMKASKLINEAYEQTRVLSESANPMKIGVFKETPAFVQTPEYKQGYQAGARAASRAANKISKQQLDPYAQAKLQIQTDKAIQNNRVNAAQRLKDINQKSTDDEFKPLSKPQLNEQKVKKANSLNPMTMTVNFKVKASNDAVVSVESMIGVKAKLYPVDSMEIIDRIYSDKDTKINLFNFIRAFSGEIAFWRDFVFALSKAKIDANFNAKRVGSKLWKVLERRSKTSKISQMLNINNSATAITTLVLSAEEAGFLYKEYDIDLLDSAVARKLLDDFNFIGIMVVDENLETIRMIMDTGSDEWEQNTFQAFERDEEMDYKQMVKMLAKAY